MEIGPIFRALINHRTRFWLIVTEIALTLAIVANCVHMIQDRRAKMLRPTGMDVANILVVESEPFAAEFQDDDYVEAAYQEDLRTLRSLPGVRAASAMHQIPLSGGGSSTSRRAEGSEEETRSAPYFVVGTDIIDALGVEIVAGRAFDESDYPTREQEDAWADRGDEPRYRNVIITQDLADAMFPEGGAVGKALTSKDGLAVDRVVGVMRRMQCSWPLSSIAERVMLFPSHPASSRRARYMVRAEPGMVDGLYTSLEEKLLGVNDGRLVSVQTLAEIKGDYYRDLTAMNQLMVGLSILLITVTSLGIIGLTAFSVTQRTREIGTRRALGATRLAILRYFLVENWVTTTSGLALGIVFTYGLNYALANLAEAPRIDFPTVAFGMVVLWGVGLVAALAPAIRGTAVQPVVATQSI